MTILDTTNRRFYTGNGTATTYAINSLSGDALTGIIIFNITDIKVYLDGVLQTYTTHYTITSDTPPSAFAGKLVNASVVFVTAPADDVEIAIVREIPYTQELGLSNGNNVPPKPLESQLDKLSVQAQQLNEALNERIIRVAEYESTSLNALNPEDGKYLKWESGQLVNTTPIEIGVDISNATIAQVATNTANIATNTANIATNTADIAVLETVHVPTGYINTPAPQYAGVQSISINGTASAKSGDDLYNLQAFGNNTVSLGFAGLNGLATGAVANNTWYYLYLVAQANGLAGGYLFDTTQGQVSHTLNTENRVLWSEDLSQATWVKNGTPLATVTADNLISPSGVLNADTVTDSTDTANSSIQQDFTAGSTTSTLLFYAKRVNTDWLRIQFTQGGNRVNLWFNLLTGALGTQNTGGTAPTGISVSSQSAGNGWYRVAITATFLSTALRCVFNTASADASNVRVSNGAFGLWGVQCVNGSVILPYAKTEGSIVTGTSTFRSRQLPLAVRTDASSNILPFVIEAWHGRSSSTLYRDSEEASAYQVLSSGTASTFTAVSCSSLVPPNSRVATMNVIASGDTGGAFGGAWTRETGASISVGKRVAYWTLSSGNWDSASIYHNTQSLNASQQFDYRRNFGSVSIWITGYTINL